MSMRSADAIIRTLEATRSFYLLFTLPATIVWARGFGQHNAAAGALLAGAHAAIVVLWMSSGVRADLRAGRMPRLGLSQARDATLGEAADITWFISLLLTAALCAAMLFASFWMGVGVCALAVAGMWHSGQRLSYRLTLVELILPAAWIAGPAILLSLNDADPQLLSRAGLAACLMIAASLVAVVTLLLVRDMRMDGGEGAATIATRLGRGGAIAVVWLWSLAILTLAIAGASSGWWHWSAAAMAGWTIAGVLALSTAGRDDHAPIAAAVGLGLASVIVGCTAGV